MRFGLSLGAVATACVLAAQAPAHAAPLTPFPAAAIRVADKDALVQTIGYRHDRHQRYYGGISYVSEYGLKYAPTYYHRHHGPDVSVNVYIGPRESDRYRRHTQPLIIELSK